MRFSLEESMAELSELAGTAGLEVAGSTYQRVLEPNPRTYIGTGKVSESLSTCKSELCLETSSAVVRSVSSLRPVGHGLALPLSCRMCANKVVPASCTRQSCFVCFMNLITLLYN